MSEENRPEDRPDWRWWSKVAVAGAVAAATTIRNADGIPLWLKAVCDGVLAVGVIVGIGSTGLRR